MKWVPLATLGVLAWVGITLLLAAKLPGFRPEKEEPWEAFGRWFASGKLPVFRKGAFDGPVTSLPWTPWVPRVMAVIWAVAGLVAIRSWWTRGASRRAVVPVLAGLAVAAALAGGLSAAQMVPAVEFTGLTGRATDEGAHDIYPFSLEPYRLAEAFIPGLFGRRFGQPVMWAELLFPSLNHRLWVPSLYLGGLTAVLAVGAFGFRGGTPWRAWLSAIIVVSVIGSFGEFASPLTVARFVPSLTESLGPHDAKQTNAVRLDGYLRDGDGSPYFLMSELLPGFSQFRFPSKLLTFTTLAVAALGGLGWDRAVERRSKRLATLALAGSAATLASLGIVFASQGQIAGLFEKARQVAILGTFDIPGALVDLKQGLAQATLVLASTGALVILARRRANLAGLLAVVVLTIDLGSANALLIRTVPQADFDLNPKVVRLIAEAERLDPSPGPYRIHRMPIWSPIDWQKTKSVDRIRDFVRWEHETIQPKYGLLHGIDYTQTVGVAELYDYAWFFAPFPRAAKPEAAALLGIKTGDQIVVYPRRGFDLWNSRYFVLPALPRLNEVERGTATFIPQTDRIYPPDNIFNGKFDNPDVKHWLEIEDFQILRNRTAFPRAWVVHEARFSKPISGLTRSTRKETMEEILYPNDPFWSGPLWTFRDPKKLAWIETNDPAPISRFLQGSNSSAGDAVKVLTAESAPSEPSSRPNLTPPAW